MTWLVELSGWWIVLICLGLVVITVGVAFFLHAVLPVPPGLTFLFGAGLIMVILYVWFEGNLNEAPGLAMLWSSPDVWGRF